MAHADSGKVILWVLRMALALVFALAGGFKVVAPEGIRAHQPSLATLSSRRLAFIGWSELVGSLGLLLPPLTGVLPWLSALAALGLASVMLLATAFHIRLGELRRGEYRNSLNTAVLCALALVVGCGQMLAGH